MTDGEELEVYKGMVRHLLNKIEPVLFAAKHTGRKHTEKSGVPVMKSTFMNLEINNVYIENLKEADKQVKAKVEDLEKTDG